MGGGFVKIHIFGSSPSSERTVGQLVGLKLMSRHLRLVKEGYRCGVPRKYFHDYSTVEFVLPHRRCYRGIRRMRDCGFAPAAPYNITGTGLYIYLHWSREVRLWGFMLHTPTKE